MIVKLFYLQFPTVFLSSPTKDRKLAEVKPTFWLVLCRENGVLEVSTLFIQNIVNWNIKVKFQKLITLKITLRGILIDYRFLLAYCTAFLVYRLACSIALSVHLHFGKSKISAAKRGAIIKLYLLDVSEPSFYYAPQHNTCSAGIRVCFHFAVILSFCQTIIPLHFHFPDDNSRSFHLSKPN